MLRLKMGSSGGLRKRAQKSLAAKGEAGFFGCG
jgi:hypothetical protein